MPQAQAAQPAQPAQQRLVDRPTEPLNADSWALHEGATGETVEPVVEEIQGRGEQPATTAVEEMHFPEVGDGNGNVHVGPSGQVPSGKEMIE